MGGGAKGRVVDGEEWMGCEVKGSATTHRVVRAPETFENYKVESRVAEDHMEEDKDSQRNG